jgi:hypothetical protein
LGALTLRAECLKSGHFSDICGIKKTAPTEAGAVPDWDGLLYSTKSLDRGGLMVSIGLWLFGKALRCASG